jgi:adenine deaminase
MLLVAGTDAANPGTGYGISLHYELARLVDAGLTPIEALAAATAVPTERFCLNDRGRIAPALQADLLLVSGDPTRAISATRDIVAVWRRGRLFDREALSCSTSTAAALSRCHFSRSSPQRRSLPSARSRAMTGAEASRSRSCIMGVMRRVLRLRPANSR